jgi:hypothetical protein
MALLFFPSASASVFSYRKKQTLRLKGKTDADEETVAA